MFIGTFSAIVMICIHAWIVSEAKKEGYKAGYDDGHANAQCNYCEEERRDGWAEGYDEAKVDMATDYEEDGECPVCGYDRDLAEHREFMAECDAEDAEDADEPAASVLELPAPRDGYGWLPEDGA